MTLTKIQLSNSLMCKIYEKFIVHHMINRVLNFKEPDDWLLLTNAYHWTLPWSKQIKLSHFCQKYFNIIIPLMIRSLFWKFPDHKILQISLNAHVLLIPASLLSYTLHPLVTSSLSGPDILFRKHHCYSVTGFISITHCLSKHQDYAVKFRELPDSHTSSFFW
jgi:hypothetical protein